MGREQRGDGGEGAAVVHTPACQADGKAAAQAPPNQTGTAQGIPPAQVQGEAPCSSLLTADSSSGLLSTQ